MFLKETQATLELDYLGVCVDNLLQSVGFGVRVWLRRAKSFVE
jgi:hypothetical protein